MSILESSTRAGEGQVWVCPKGHALDLCEMSRFFEREDDRGYWVTEHRCWICGSCVSLESRAKLALERAAEAARRGKVNGGRCLDCGEFH